MAEFSNQEKPPMAPAAASGLRRDAIPCVLASWKDRDRLREFTAAEIGGKAVGLLRLPEPWVPPFLVLTCAFFDTARKIGGVLATSESLPGPEAELLQSLLAGSNEPGSEWHKILVRSNSPDESIESRGAFQSYASEASLPFIARRIEELLQSAAAKPMFAILQPAIEPGLLGHMSNERRVSARRNKWLVEWHYWDKDRPRHDRVQSGGSFDPTKPLDARTDKDVLQRLREVGDFLVSAFPTRHHCEWVWSGRKLWMVQADEAQPDRIPADDYLSSREVVPLLRKPTSGDLQHFSCVNSDSWRKLRCPKRFASAGLPVADVYLLTGDSWTACSRVPNPALLADLRALAEYPVVVRTDLADGVPGDDTLLPTSPPASDFDTLAGYMDSIARLFDQRGIDDRQWAFLVAHLVPARASAMIWARPGVSTVRVDALWGFPDGLLHFPHDTYNYHLNSRKLESHIRYKGVCLLPRGGGWIPQQVGAPFDWAAVLDEEEVATLAGWGSLLARNLNTEVQLMALAHIGGNRGTRACLPWHYTTFEVPSYAESLRSLPIAPVYDTIEGFEDIERLRRQPISSGRIHGYLVRPRPELIRVDDFLVKVAALAKEKSCVLLFEGSVLGHAYYVMSREGANVVPITEEKRLAGRTTYHKLVRDLIPMIIEETGGLARVRTVRRDAAVSLLKQKLIEEAFETWNAAESSLVDELADVLEVVDALREHGNIDTAKLEKVRQAKRTRRGGFRDLIYLEETAVRSFQIDAPASGQLPLITTDTGPSRRTRPSTPKAIQVVYEDESKAVLSFSVPLVPPVNQKGIRKTTEGSVGGMGLSLHYEPPRLVITMKRALATDEPVDGQLALFKFPLDEGPRR